MILGTEVVIPLLTAFAISVALSPFVIPFLRRLKIGQTERKEGEGMPKLVSFQGFLQEKKKQKCVSSFSV